MFWLVMSICMFTTLGHAPTVRKRAIVAAAWPLALLYTCVSIGKDVNTTMGRYQGEVPRH